MRGALCVATRLYILYLAADESISGWEFFLLIPKSPQVLYFLGDFAREALYNVCVHDSLWGDTSISEDGFELVEPYTWSVSVERWNTKIYGIQVTRSSFRLPYYSCYLLYCSRILVLVMRNVRFQILCWTVVAVFAKNSCWESKIICLSLSASDLNEPWVIM